MSVSLNGTNGLTFNDASTQNTSAFYGGLAMRNRIINGAMVIDQRNAGASVTPTTDGYTLDRWNFNVSQASKFSVQQNAGSVTPPVGFSNYLGATSLSAYSLGSSDFFFFRQHIEGFNFADMGFGTASAKTITLSFQVYSSLTGTFGGVVKNAGASRSYPFLYTVSSANTWTTASVTIPGDTSGTWAGATNGTGLAVLFNLGAGSTFLGTAGAWASANYIGATGSVSVVGTSGATFYITGVQLEKGSTATSFDYRPYTTELMLCQRYYEFLDGIYSTNFNGSLNRTDITNLVWKVTKRAIPTLAIVSSASASGANTLTAFGVQSFYISGAGMLGIAVISGSSEL